MCHSLELMMIRLLYSVCTLKNIPKCSHAALYLYLFSHFHSSHFLSLSLTPSLSITGGAAVRTQITERVFTANESPSSEKIPFHHEMSQVPEPPTHLFFYCQTPPEEGGEVKLLSCGNLRNVYGGNCCSLILGCLQHLDRRNVQQQTYMILSHYLNLQPLIRF